jgi:hypothetical protein
MHTHTHTRAHTHLNATGRAEVTGSFEGERVFKAEAPEDSFAPREREEVLHIETQASPVLERCFFFRSGWGSRRALNIETKFTNKEISSSQLN